MQNSTNAERQRGCFFADDFITRASVESNNGTVTGAPQFGNGMVLDGTNDYVTYNVAAPHFTGNEFSCVMDFKPDFATSENAFRRLFHTTNGFSIAKLQNSLNNGLRIILDGIIIEDIPKATYSPYWNQGEINRLVLTSDSGDTSVWLNGAQILTNDASGWAFSAFDDLCIGATIGGGNNFKGTIYSFRAFNIQLDDNEAESYNSWNVYNYKNQTSVDLPMLMEQHDPENNRTLDLSGNNNHAVWTPGATQPSKNTTMPGYNFDGTNDVMNIASSTSNTFGNGTTDQPFSISYWGKIENASNFFGVIKRNGAIAKEYQLGIATNKQLYFVLHDQSTGGLIGRTSPVTLAPEEGNYVHIVGTYDGVNNAGMKFYVNGVRRDTQNNSSGSYTAMENTGTPIVLGSLNAAYLDGNLMFVKILPTELTHMQVTDLYTSEQRLLNRI